MQIALDASAVCRSQQTGVSVYSKDFIKALADECMLDGGRLSLGFSLATWKQHDRRLQFSRDMGTDSFWLPGSFLTRPWLNVLRLRYPFEVFHGLDARLPALQNVPMLATIHDCAIFQIEGLASKAFIAKRYRHYQELAKRASVLLTVSDVTRNDFLKLFDFPPEQIKTVYPGLSVPFMEMAERDSKPSKNSLIAAGIKQPYLLFVGELSVRKNLKRLLEGYAESRLKDDYQLVLAGHLSFGAEAELAPLADPQVNKRVCRLGYVSHQLLMALYAHASLLAFPTRYEGFGFPILEAMACGTPIVASSVGAAGEISGGQAVLVDPLSPKEIARGLELAIEKPPSANLLKQRARQFSWQSCAKKTNSFYKLAQAVF